MSVAHPAMIHGLAVLLFCLDLAGGKFAPETVGFDDEAATVLIGRRGKPDLVCPPLPDEYLAAFIGMGGPGSGEIDGMRLSNEEQSR